MIKIKSDWKYNIDAGIDIAKKSYTAALRKNRNGQNEGDRGSNKYEENLARATYSGYNAGTANIHRYRTGSDNRDYNFWQIYKNTPWKDN
ncbi:MAG: hypothetical protein JXA66_08685 [Oligoflexia bacterium]|nr:hypothetical protein [Oligoflexia bacterium]